jgi:AAA ATPase domain
MIIELHNFGPIERFTFDTEKRMHFIFGENNVGKSYAITAVYLILKNWNKSFENTFDFTFNHLSLKEKLENAKYEINITNEIELVGLSFISSVFIPSLKESLLNSFRSLNELSNKYTRESFKIVIRSSNFIIQLSHNKNDLFVFDVSTKLMVLVSNDGKSIFEYDYSTTLQVKDDDEKLKKDIKYIFRNIFGSESNFNIYFLPASRSGIYSGLSAWSAILVQLTQFRSQNKDTKFEIPTLTEPISDYFLNLTNIEKKAYSTSFSKFAKRIEDEIVKGKINFDKGNRKLYYEPANLDLSLELSQASSMISEIAPIIAHLKFIFDDEENVKNGRNYIFIEEPEAHLHPKVQVALIQLFAEMSKEGLHVVMTSHSNYMFNKLSNMVLAKEIAPETISVGLMKLGEKGSYIDENAMHIDEDGIDDDNFSETAEALYTERLKLYEQNP